MSTESTPTIELHIKRFPEDLNTKAKVAAAHRRITLRELIIRAITKDIHDTEA